MPGHYSQVYICSRLVRAKCFIDAHFHEHIDLDNIADEAYFSKFHFIRLFKKVYGETPHHYLTAVRIENAKKLLQKNIPVSTACFMVGFESVSSFTALFRRYTQLCPSEFQLRFKCHTRAMLMQPLHFVPSCFAEKHGWLQNSNFEESENAIIAEIRS